MKNIGQGLEVRGFLEMKAKGKDEPRKLFYLYRAQGPRLGFRLSPKPSFLKSQNSTNKSFRRKDNTKMIISKIMRYVGSPLRIMLNNFQICYFDRTLMCYKIQRIILQGTIMNQTLKNVHKIGMLRNSYSSKYQR